MIIMTTIIMKMNIKIKTMKNTKIITFFPKIIKKRYIKVKKQLKEKQKNLIKLIMKNYEEGEGFNKSNK